MSNLPCEHMISSICWHAEIIAGDSDPKQISPSILAEAGPTDAIRAFLTAWSKASPLPIILMLDEVDALSGDVLISLLRQFAHCGSALRIHRSQGGSAFNVKAESLRLGKFTEAEIRLL